MYVIVVEKQGNYCAVTIVPVPSTSTASILRCSDCQKETGTVPRAKTHQIPKYHHPIQ